MNGNNSCVKKMTTRQILIDRLKDLFDPLETFYYGDEGTGEVPWNEINELIEMSPQLIWDTTLHDVSRPVIAAIITRNLEELKFLNATLRENSAPSVLYDRLVAAFESRTDIWSDDVLYNATISNLEIFRYLVEECCPSGVNILENDILAHAMLLDNVEIVDYILSNAPRGLAMLDDAAPYQRSTTYRQRYINNGKKVGDYLAKIELIFLEKEGARAQQALADLEAEGFELPALVLGVIRDNTDVIQYRQR